MEDGRRPHRRRSLFWDAGTVLIPFVALYFGCLTRNHWLFEMVWLTSVLAEQDVAAER